MRQEKEDHVEMSRKSTQLCRKSLELGLHSPPPEFEKVGDEELPKIRNWLGNEIRRVGETGKSPFSGGGTEPYLEQIGTTTRVRSSLNLSD